MADANAFRKVADAIRIENNIEIIVVSAGGKTGGYPKITDMLVDAYRKIQKGESVKKSLNSVFERVRRLKEDLQLKLNLENELMKIEVGANDPDFLISRGEYLYSFLFSKFFEVAFVDAKEIFKFCDNGEINEEYTCFNIREKYKSVGKFVTGGFYGSDDFGKIKTFSRGGGDVSGAIAAKAINADLFVDFTDVDGVYAYDPKVVAQTSPMQEISYSTLENLAKFGATVIHPKAVEILSESETNTVVKNTFHPRKHGTFVRKNPREKYFAAAAKDGCVYVKITGEINVKNLLIEDGRIGILYRENEVVTVYDRQINLPKELKRNDLYVETDRSVTAFYVSLSDSTPQFIETVKGSVETYAIFDIADGYIIAIPSKGRRDVENIICQVISGE